MSVGLPHLDSPTLMFALSVFTFAMSALAFVAYRSFGNNRYGHLHMALAMAHAGTASLLFFLAEVVPFFWPMVVGDLCVLQFMPHTIAAYCRILGIRPPKRIMLLSSLLGMAGVVLTQFLAFSMVWAMVSVSSALAWQFLMLLQLLLSQRQRRWTGLDHAYKALLGIASLLFASRCVTALVGDVAHVLPTSQSSQQLATLCFTTTVAVLSFLVYIELVHQQVQKEITERLQRDGLTGLLTRTAFGEMQAQIARRAAHEDFALLMLDIDHFKAINDSFGHQGGDHVLSHAGRFIAASLRLTDIAVRYGGEEFCLLLWNCDTEAAERLSNRLVQEAPRQQVRLHNGQTTRFTLSVGYAVHSRDSAGESLVQVIARADHALYLAKRGGRNQALAALSPAEFAVAQA